MGIQGFTKFINDRAHLYFENHELRDCTLIIDGHSISCQLYNWRHWQFDGRSINSYGGDYDKYAYIVENFFKMLLKVNVKPIVIFDGGFEQRKLPTILTRMQDKIKIADQLNPNSDNQVVFPLFLRECFKDVLISMDITMFMCKYEGDTEIASVARALNCPVLTFDSDYFLFGVQYIPFKTMDSKVLSIENWRTGAYQCISCKLYRIEKFLESFPGLKETTLHLLPVLLGNDYIDMKIFEYFLSSIEAFANLSTQQRIELVLNWLKGETFQSAILKILNSFNTIEQKLFILKKIEKIVTAYHFVDSRVIRCLNVEGHKYKKHKKNEFSSLKKIIESGSDQSEKNGTHLPQTLVERDKQKILENAKMNSKEDSQSDQSNTTAETKIDEKELNCTQGSLENELIDINLEWESNETTSAASSNADPPSNKVIENINQDDCSQNGDYKIKAETSQSPKKSDNNEKLPSTSAFNFTETHLERENTSENPISKQFEKNFFKCLYPSSFMDILTQNKYYCIPQVEDSKQENSHLFSFDILRAIHSVLTGAVGSDFTIVGRGEGTNIKWFPQEKYIVQVPSLEEIEQLTLQGRREFFLRILNIDNIFVSLLENFPTEWHTFLVAVKFAVSKTTFKTPLMYSLILSFIILNYIDQRIGYYRSSERYKKRYYSFMQNLPPKNEFIPFRTDKNCFYYFPLKDCIVCLQQVIHLFTVDPKETVDSFDRQLVHQMAQIQSILLHIKYLNSLLKSPYPNVVIHQIFDGTFIYNLTKAFTAKSTELDNYLNIFFKDCPTILAALQYVLNILNKENIV